MRMKQITKLEHHALRLRDAGFDPDEIAAQTGITVREVRALWLHDDEEEDSELNAICEGRQNEVAVEIDIDNI